MVYDDLTPEEQLLCYDIQEDLETYKHLFEDLSEEFINLSDDVKSKYHIIGKILPLSEED